MNVRLLTLYTAFACSSLLSACGTTLLNSAEEKASPAPVAVGSAAQQGQFLFQAVEEHVRSQGSTLSDIPHQTAYTDLNDDGKIDVLLMLTAPEWCIGDSCTLMIFEGTDTGAKLLAELTLISSPISVGDLQESGWRDVFVTLPGTAGQSTMAKVSHNGSVYPESPSNWKFLTDAKALPGRPVLVGGGAEGTDLAQFDELLAEVDGTNAVAAMTVESDEEGLSAISSDSSYYGRYSWGPGEAYFRPCGGSSVYWVTAEEPVAAELDKQYRQIARQQFDDVYLVMKASSAEAPKEGEASFYDGVLDVEEVITMDSVGEDTCSQVPAS